MKMLFAFLLILNFSGAQAEEIAQAPCKADMEKLCAGIEPGDGRMMKCMEDNEEKLSTECKAKRAERKDKMKDIHEACEADIEKFCTDVKPGKGKMMKCLKKHKDELSQACKDATPKRHKK